MGSTKTEARQRIVNKDVRAMAEIGRRWMADEGTERIDQIVARARRLEREIRETQQLTNAILPDY